MIIRNYATEQIDFDPPEELLAAWDSNAALAEENIRLRAELAEVETKQTEKDYALLEVADLCSRAMRNQQLSDIQFRLYVALLEVYPELLSGESVDYQPWKLMLAAGGAKKDSTRYFIVDMMQIEALYIDPLTNMLTANLDVFTAPETFNLRETARSRVAREKQEIANRTYKMNLQITNCEVCDSKEIEYDVTARCKSCGHVHDTTTNIPAKLITIKPDKVEALADEPLTFEGGYTGFIADTRETEIDPSLEQMNFSSLGMTIG